MRELIVVQQSLRTGEGETIQGYRGINPAAVAQFEFYPAAGGKVAGCWYRLIGSEYRQVLTGAAAEHFERTMRGSDWGWADAGSEK